MIHQPYTWVEISRGALEHNLSQFKKIIGEGILAPVIKGNAYGHGLDLVGHVCEQSPHVGWLCVAMLSEALTLRKAGITKPILVLVCLDDDAQKAIEHDIDILVCDSKTAQLLDASAKKLNKKSTIHIQIDTGMSRFGFFPEEVISHVEQIAKLQHTNIRGIATHFAESHAHNQQFTQQQVNLFNTVIAKLKKKGITIAYKHACNSTATLRFNSPTGNFFRIGIGTYGYWSSDYIQKMITQKLPNFILKPVLAWKTRILSLKTVPTGTFIGYDKAYKAQQQTVLATLPVGYGDGYNHRLYDKAPVLVNGTLAPIVGKIGMNVIMIDVSAVPNPHIGDEVTLVGDHPGIRADDLAALESKNSREVTTKIAASIKRILCP